VLFNAGDQDPVIPLVETVGNAVKTPPEQIELIGANVGVTGVVTFTVIEFDEAEVHVPEVAVTVYVPAEETVIDWVNTPFDHVFPELADEVNTTDPP